MANGKLVFTGPYGPGLSVTSRTINNLAIVTFDFARGVIRLIPTDETIPSEQLTLDYSAIATFTASIASGVTTITLS